MFLELESLQILRKLYNAFVLISIKKLALYWHKIEIKELNKGMSIFESKLILRVLKAEIKILNVCVEINNNWLEIQLSPSLGEG